MGKTATLPIHLHGPLMSFGNEKAREGERPSDTMPRKSMVVGLLAAALGRERGEDIEDLASLRFGCLVVKRGKIENDFQRVDYKVEHKSKTETIVGNRGYITDGDFIVAVEGERELLDKLHKALLSPRWTLYMGRSSCPAPPDLAMDVIELPLKEALVSLMPEFKPNGAKIRIESRGGTQVFPVCDKPISFEWGNRRYGSTIYEEFFERPEGTEGNGIDFFDFI